MADEISNEMINRGETKGVQMASSEPVSFVGMGQWALYRWISGAWEPVASQAAYSMGNTQFNVVIGTGDAFNPLSCLVTVPVDAEPGDYRLWWRTTRFNPMGMLWNCFVGGFYVP